MTGVHRVDLSWCRSSRSSSKGYCVEVAFAEDQAVLTRDSKRPEGAVLEFSAGDWSAFLGALRTNRFTS